MPDLPPIRSIQDALAALATLQSASNVTARGAWTRAQILGHCAQSVEYSLDGFPRHKPALIRATVGRLVLRHFLAKGSMSHNRAAAIPGAPAIPADSDWPSQATRLHQALQRFAAHGGPCAEHFVYGPVTAAQYARLHCMHLADHFAELQPA